MKAKDFAQFLKNWSELLAGQGGNNAGAWKELAKVIEIKPAATVADICKHLKAAPPAPGQGIDNVIDGLRGLEALLKPYAKKALIDDLAKLADALAPHRNASIEGLSSAIMIAVQANKSKSVRSQKAELNVGAIERHLRRLETALGDEAGFEEAFEALKNDKSIKAPEAKRLAREFAKGTAASKDKALKLIWGRHAALMLARAKGAATAGRTAA